MSSFMITCKYEEDLIKNEGARVLTTLYIKFSDAQGQITLVSVVVSGQNLSILGRSKDHLIAISHSKR